MSSSRRRTSSGPCGAPTTSSPDAVAVGFDATVAIHPDQVGVIRDAYAPSDERVGWAQRLLASVGTDRGVTTFEGRMVDGPVFRQAERILTLARDAATTSPPD